MQKKAFVCGLLWLCAVESPAQTWVGTWAASPIGEEVSVRSPSPTNQTYRNTVHVSLGSESIRVLLTNEFGTNSLTVGAAHVAVSAGGGALQAGTDHALTFGGKGTVNIPPGAFVTSDPVTMHVDSLSDLVVSTYLPKQPMDYTTCHDLALSTSYVFKGDATAAPKADGATPLDAWCFLKGIDAAVSKESAAIVTLGDSITDGSRSSIEKNRRWPDVLAVRLRADKRTAHLSVLNQGIGGNRLVHEDYGPSALARFDRDVIAQSGVKFVVLLEGINDIGKYAKTRNEDDKVTLADLIFGFTQLATRAHQHGLKIFAATVLPYTGAGYCSPSGEEMRRAYNQWLRTSGIPDAVIDFDKVTQDPVRPDTLLPAYDSGDHLHPSDVGYKAMGDSIDLSFFVETSK